MNLRFQQLAFFLLFIISVTGCQVATFSNPLVDPAEAKVPQEILGSYWMTHGDQLAPLVEFESTPNDRASHSIEYQHIGIAGDDHPPGFVRIVRVDVPQNSFKKIESSSLVGFAARVGEHFVLHIPIPKKLPIDETTYQGSWKPENFQGYLLAVIKPTGAGLELHLVDSDFIVSEIEAGRLQGNYTAAHPVAEVDQSGRLISTQPPELNVTADSKSLAAFFQRHLNGNLLEKTPTKYQRIR